MALVWAASTVVLLTACQQGSGSTQVPGDAGDNAAFSAIGPGETIEFTGTEPFWGGEVEGDMLRYSTPENIDGQRIEVTRFAGRGGLSLSGSLNGARFDMTITEAECGDGMSDRTYPFVATLRLGEEIRNGCAWTQARPFDGPRNP